MFGKCWRVKDYKIVLPSHPVEILEGIFGKGFMTLVAREVKFYVGTCEVNGLG